jgi:hypothetical protein
VAFARSTFELAWGAKQYLMKTTVALASTHEWCVFLNTCGVSRQVMRVHGKTLTAAKRELRRVLRERVHLNKSGPRRWEMWVDRMYEGYMTCCHVGQVWAKSKLVARVRLRAVRMALSNGRITVM